MEEPRRNSTFIGPSGEARRDNEYQVREKGVSWKLREEHASERSGQLFPVSLRSHCQQE